MFLLYTTGKQLQTPEVSLEQGVPVNQRCAWTGSGLDILQDSCDFLDQDWIWRLFLKKIGSGQDQDICLISITKFS